MTSNKFSRVMQEPKLTVKWDWGFGFPYEFSHQEVQMLYAGGGDTWLRDKWERQTGKKLPPQKRGFQTPQPAIDKADMLNRLAVHIAHLESLKK